MAIFAVIQQPGTHDEKLAGAVASAFPSAHYQVAAGVWLVAGAGTAQDISNKIGITPADLAGSAIVLESASYFGRANPAVWSWIKANWESPSLG